MTKNGIVIIALLIVVLFSGFYYLRSLNIIFPDQEAQTPTFGVKGETVVSQIAIALAKKNAWDASELVIKVTLLEGNFAKGEVTYQDELGGGLWFAAKVGGKWEIVYDGNGIIPCDSLTKYRNFPTSIIPQCYDRQTDTLLTR